VSCFIHVWLSSSQEYLGPTTPGPVASSGIGVGGTHSQVVSFNVHDGYGCGE